MTVLSRARESNASPMRASTPASASRSLPADGNEKRTLLLLRELHDTKKRLVGRPYHNRELVESISRQIARLEQDMVFLGAKKRAASARTAPFAKA